jgi:hypothetical protein
MPQSLAGPAPAAEKVKVTLPAVAVTFASLYHAQRRQPAGADRPGCWR